MIVIVQSPEARTHGLEDKRYNHASYSRFRWDYFRIYKRRTGKELEGFRRFMSEGVRTEYLESVFPAESFPAWQTIQTGE